jgi:hypothetical protein
LALDHAPRFRRLRAITFEFQETISTRSAPMRWWASLSGCTSSPPPAGWRRPMLADFQSRSSTAPAKGAELRRDPEPLRAQYALTDRELIGLSR